LILGHVIWLFSIGTFIRWSMSMRTIMDAWDEANLKFTFRRTISKLEILMEW
jgi:hypothetical protein